MDYIARYLSLKFLGNTPPRLEYATAPDLASSPDDAPSPGPGKRMTVSRSGSDDESLVGSTVEEFLDAAEHAGAKEAKVHVEIDATASFRNQEDAPPCPNCGSITVRSGSCYSCPNCGNTSGCG